MSDIVVAVPTAYPVTAANVGETTIVAAVAVGSPGAEGPPGSGALPNGGTTGQHLAKVSNANQDAGWVDPEAGATSLDDLTDVNTAGVTNGDALVFDGTGWVPGAVSGGSVADTDVVVDGSAIGLPNPTDQHTVTLALADGLTTALGRAALAAEWHTTTGNVTVSVGDNETFGLDATAGNATATLPAFAGVSTGKAYLFIRTDASGNTVTISGDANVNGAASITLTTQWSWALVVKGDTQWAAFIPGGGGGGGGGAVDSVNGETGAVALVAGDIPFNPNTVDTLVATEVQGAIDELTTTKATVGDVLSVQTDVTAAFVAADAAHVADSDPHTQYQTESGLAAAVGALNIDGGQINTGVVADIHIAGSIARDSEVTAAISTHAGATDPHGDRAFATSADVTVASTASADATSKANAAQSAAISSAATDATTKANAAQAASQPLDADLTTIAAIAPGSDGVLAWVTSSWVHRTWAQVKTALGLVKADVGLGSVDNTADTAKPVSTAQQTALNLKADLASPSFTGIPIVPTATAGTSTTQAASTAFVAAATAPSFDQTLLSQVFS